MDFTLTKYRQLLEALIESGITFKLRHDVDLLPQNSYQTALIENELGLKATYYFRCVPESSHRFGSFYVYTLLGRSSQRCGPQYFDASDLHLGRTATH